MRTEGSLVLDKFNLYDVLGYLIPGGTVLLLSYWFALVLLARPVPNLNLDLGQSLLLVAVSYVFGHLLASLGEIYERLSNRRNGGRVSERILRRYPRDYQDLIEGSAREIFQLDKRQRISDAQLFQLSWSLLTQKSADSHPQVYLAISGLSRSMMVISGWGILLSALLVAKQLVLLATGPLDQGWRYDGLQLWTGIFLLVAFGLTAFVSHFHWMRFREYFAWSVYDNFIALRGMRGKG
jgi:hypothetical protein